MFSKKIEKRLFEMSLKKEELLRIHYFNSIRPKF